MTQAMHQVLVIEDEPAIRTVLRVLLQAEGYRVIEADTAMRAEIEARSHKPDLLLIDLGLPDADGLKVIRRVRSWSQVPIVVLSARTMEEQKIAALDAGADDYVTKPVGIDELLARLRAVLRRTAPSGEPVIEVGELVVDLQKRDVRMAGKHVHLTPHQFDLLRVLALNVGKLLTQRQLLQEVWGPGYTDAANLLQVNVSQLRRKLEPDRAHPRYLLTETGAGYRLVEPD
jgi:two-component system, OmpR family, KDP operon response regulator KdpE